MTDTAQDDLVKQMNDARNFPANTCGASRHAAMIAEALCRGEDYPMLAEEPDHCGESIAATVAALWECRTKLELISEEWHGAVYGDLENGVASLNEAAAKDFYRSYPLVANFGVTLNRIIDGGEDE